MLITAFIAYPRLALIIRADARGKHCGSPEFGRYNSELRTAIRIPTLLGWTVLTIAAGTCVTLTKSVTFKVLVEYIRDAIGCGGTANE